MAGRNPDPPRFSGTYQTGRSSPDVARRSPHPSRHRSRSRSRLTWLDQLAPRSTPGVVEVRRHRAFLSTASRRTDIRRRGVPRFPHRWRSASTRMGARLGLVSAALTATGDEHERQADEDHEHEGNTETVHTKGYARPRRAVSGGIAGVLSERPEQSQPQHRGPTGTSQERLTRSASYRVKGPLS